MIAVADHTPTDLDDQGVGVIARPYHGHCPAGTVPGPKVIHTLRKAVETLWKTLMEATCRSSETS